MIKEMCMFFFNIDKTKLKKKSSWPYFDSPFDGHYSFCCIFLFFINFPASFLRSLRSWESSGTQSESSPSGSAIEELESTSSSIKLSLQSYVFGSPSSSSPVETLLAEKPILRSDLLAYLRLMHYYYGREKSTAVKKTMLKLPKIAKNIIENFYAYEIFYTLQFEFFYLACIFYGNTLGF